MCLHEIDRDLSIGIVIPVKNEGTQIDRLLRSLCDARIDAAEIIVVDNKSVDDTIEKAKAFGVKVISGGPDVGSQRNQGARACVASHLLFLDADMEVASPLISELLDLAMRGHECIIIPEISVANSFLMRGKAFERSFQTGDLTIESARFFSRTVFERAGGYPEGMWGGEDWLLAKKAYAITEPVRTRSTLLHHEKPLSILQLFKKNVVYGRGYYQLFRSSPKLFAEHANPARPSLKANLKVLAQQPDALTALVLYKAVVYAAGLIGFAEAALRSVFKRPLI